MLTDEQRGVIKHQLTEYGLEELLPQVELVIRGLASGTDILDMVKVAYRIGLLKGGQNAAEAQNAILRKFPHIFFDD